MVLFGKERLRCNVAFGIYFTRNALENYVLSGAVQLTPEMNEYLAGIYSENFENTEKNIVEVTF